MSYDEQRISDKIDGGLLNEKREHIENYVKNWIEQQEPDTFVKNKNGEFMYSANHSTLNLTIFFQMLLEDYITENNI